MRSIPMLLPLLMLLVDSPAGAQDSGWIGCFTDAQATCRFYHDDRCNTLDAPPFVAKQFYVVASPNIFNTSGGVNGVEFGIDGAPDSGELLLTAVSNPAATVVLGDPFKDHSQPAGSRGGTNLAWPECQVPDANGLVLFYTVTATNLGGATGIRLDVGAKEPPTNPNFPCPLINACDPPVYTALCAYGIGPLWINPSTAIESRHWSRVKQLYR